MNKHILLILGIFYMGPALAQNFNSERGEGIFEAECARCHTSIEMQRRLQNDWAGRSAEELYQQIRATMPAESPGSLSDSEYLDVTLYTMESANAEVPEGEISEGDLASLIVDPATEERDLESIAWTHFNGDLSATRYAWIDQINADNVDELEIAWSWTGANFDETVSVASPLMANGLLYSTAGSTRNVVAMDPATGHMQWMWRPDEGERFVAAPRKGSGKGLAYRREGDREIIFTVTPGYYLVALNARTGLPVESFGAGGWVDLQEGLREAPDRDDLDIGLSFPPTIVDDVIVVGAAMAPGGRPPSESNVKGDVRAYDVHTGEQLWTFHTIPEPGEFGYDTWQNGSAEYTGNAGVWAPMSADPELGLVYLPVEAPTGDYNGGHRPGENLFSSSLVALNYRTGEREWHFQHTHHDIWDWDTPAAPILADLPDGRKAVFQVTKQGYVYAFDRATGEPIWDIEEKPVPQTDLPGEWTSPTQPIPSKPAPFDRQGFTEDDIIDFTPELRRKALELVQPFRMGGLFTPPSEIQEDGNKGTLSLPSSTGGGNWEGSAYDPETGMLYIPSRTALNVLGMTPGGDDSSMRYIRGNQSAPSIDGLTIVKPPYGRITAIDMTNGEHVWQVANGDTPEEIAEHPALEGVDLPRTGKPTRAGILLTETLLFAGEGRGGDPMFRAHDKQTGEILAEIELPATQTGQPMTYMHEGRQYILMTVSDSDHTAELVALALPE